MNRYQAVQALIPVLMICASCNFRTPGSSSTFIPLRAESVPWACCRNAWQRSPAICLTNDGRRRRSHRKCYNNETSKIRCSSLSPRQVDYDRTSSDTCEICSGTTQVRCNACKGSGRLTRAGYHARNPVNTAKLVGIALYCQPVWTLVFCTLHAPVAFKSCWCIVGW